MGNVRLDYVVPTERLGPFVTLFYLFQSDEPLDDIERADHAQLRFRLSGGSSDYRFSDATRQIAPPIHFLAATSAAVSTRASGPVRVFGMGLTPAGWRTLVGMDASALLSRVIDAEAVLGGEIRAMAATLDRCTTAEAMVAAIEPMLWRLTDHASAETLRFVDAVDAWLSASSSPELADIVATTGLSQRQVERRCKALYGAPPKMLARKYRALRAAVMMTANGNAVDDFYDQSHMIREVRQFTGLTPRRIRKQPGQLAQMTIAQRTALHGRVNPLISDT